MNSRGPRQNPQGFTTYTDNTATPTNPLVIVNQNNQYVLRPLVNNQQLPPQMPHPTTMPFPIEYWMDVYTQPGDTRSHLMYLSNPQQFATAQNTQYLLQGQPIVVDRGANGYEVRGEWHYGYLERVWNEQYNRSNPDVTPTWSTEVLRAADNRYRATNHAVPGTVWPSAASGMAPNLPMFRTIEGSGIHYWQVTPNGYVQWQWYGTQ